MKLLAILALVAIALAASIPEGFTLARNEHKNLEWKDVVTAHAADIKSLVEKVNPEMTAKFKKTWGEDGKNENIREMVFTASGYAEIKDIATQLGLHAIDVAWYNYYLDFVAFTAVTDKESKDDLLSTIPSGEFLINLKESVVHTVSLTPIKFSTELRKLAILVHTDDVTALTFAGMVGYVFAIKKEAFSISFVNAADAQYTALNHGSLAHTFSTNLRTLTESSADYSAVTKAFNADMASPIFYSVAGTKTDEAMVVKIDSTHVTTRTFSDDVHYMGQSSEVIKDEKYIDLHDNGLAQNVTTAFGKIDKKNLSDSAVEQATVTWPGRNFDTIAVITADVGTKYQTFVLNACHNIYKDFAKERVSQCVEKADGFNLGVFIVSVVIGGTILYLWIVGAKNAKRFQNEYSSLN